jgi:predicted alpha/beta hydrolase family esterase
MKWHVLFLQGGGEGAHEADGRLVDDLRRRLPPAAYQLDYPRMPREKEPDYARWAKSIGEALGRLECRVILVGHSLGASFLLKYLSEEKPAIDIAALCLIATPYWGGDGWRYEGYERVGLRKDFGARLPQGARLFLYHSRDDETVPFAHLALYQKHLPQAVSRIFSSGGHQLNNDLSAVAADIGRLSASKLSAAP